jgi:hypothetical protein
MSHSGKYVLLFFVFLLLTNCTNTIYHLRYNPHIRGYQAGFARDSLSIQTWYTLRNPQTQVKITDQDTAKMLAAQYNEKNDERLFFSPASSMFTQYKAACLYFDGINALRRAAYQNAEQCFQKALEINQDLIYNSDIHYLRALCFNKQQKDSASDAAFNTFKILSEAIYPYSFYLPVDIPDTVYAALIHDSRLVFSKNHFSHDYKEPALKNRSFPGFLPYLYQSAAFSLRLGGLYRMPTDFYPMIALHMDLIENLEFILGYTASETASRRYLGIAYQIMRARSNRYGTVVSIFNSNVSSKDFVTTDFDYNQYAAVLEAGYFIHPRLGLFIGGALHYQDTEDKDADLAGEKEYHLWSKNNFYGGATYYFTEYLGATLLTGSQQVIKFGIRLGGGHVFFY